MRSSALPRRAGTAARATSAGTPIPPPAATRPGAAGTCCCRRSRPSSRGSAGSARARSTTSASGSSVPPADAYGVATFYALLSTVPRPRRVLHVCDDIACRCKGADAAVRTSSSAPSARPTTMAPTATSRRSREDEAVWLRSPCLGLCDQAPAALLTVAGEAPVERLFGDVDAAKAQRVLAGDLSPSDAPHPRLPQAGDPSLRLLRRVDVADPDEPGRVPGPRRVRGAPAGARAGTRRRSSAR